MPDLPTATQAATTIVNTIPVANALAALIMGGFLGLLGQGARAVVGLKGLQDQVDSPDASQTDVFSAARLLMSLMIGFLAGLAATLAMGIDKLLFISPSNLDVLLGIAAAGYVGTDFIEKFMSRFAPTSKPSAPVNEQAENAPSAVVSGSQYHAAVMDAAFKFEDLVAKRTAPARIVGQIYPYPCGSVKLKPGSQKPRRDKIKQAVLEAAGYGPAEDTKPLSEIRPTEDDSSAESLRASCYETQPFKDDHLRIITGAITASKS
jgi:hypothetical protein